MSTGGEVPTVCRCGIPVAHKLSWSQRNPGRRFVTCKFSNPVTEVQGCGTFAWVDLEQQEWQRVVIHQLLLDKKLLERQVDHLKNRVCILEDQSTNVVREYENLKVKWEKKAVAKPKVNGKVNYMLSIGLALFIVVVGVLVMYAFTNFV